MDTPLRVLIIEDSEDDALLILAELKRGGYDPAFAIVNTPEAMSSALLDQEWDILISDYSMQDFNGIDALKLLKKTDVDIPFVLVLGQIGEGVDVNALGNGVRDYMLKDNLSSLVPTINRELKEAAIRKNNFRSGKALYDTNWRLESIIEGTNVGTWEWNVQNGKTVFNEMWAQIIGYTLDELGPISINTWATFSHIDDLKRSAEILEQHFTGELPYYDCEIRMKHKNGHWVWVHDRGCVISRTKDGKPLMMFGTHEDINERKLAETTLQEALIWQKMAVKAGHVGLWDWNLITNEVSFSSEWKNQIGYDQNEIKNDFEEWRSRVHPDDIDHTFSEIQTSISNGYQGFQVEFRFHHKDGAYRWIFSQASIIKDETGLPIRVLGSHVDITDRKQVEDVLRESEGKFRNFFDNQVTGIAITSPSKVWIDVNKKLCQMFGYSREELVEMTWEQITHPDDLAPDVKQFNRLLDGEIDTYVIDKRFIHKDGTIIPVILSVACIRNEDNSMKYMIAILLDITERKYAEGALLDSEETHRSILQTALDGFWLVDIHGHLLEVNETYCKMSGYSKQELLTMRIADLEVVENENDVSTHIQKIIVHGEDRFETRHQRKDGTIFDVENSVQFRPIKGGQFVVFLRDITERKQAELALQEMKVTIGEQELYSILVEMASEGFWLLDKEFNTVYVNFAIEEMLGYAKEEMIGCSWYDFGDPDWVIRAKELEKRRESGVKESHEFLFIHKNGRKVLTRIATTPLYDGEGNFNGALGILSDITRQREAEDALKVKDMLNAIADSSGIGMCIFNPDYTIEWYNELYVKWFAPLEQTKGRNCYEVFENLDAICHGCPTKVTFETGGVAVYERSGITTCFGKDRIHTLTTSPILDDNGDVIQVVVISQDITDRIRMEEDKRHFYRDTIKSVTQGKLDLITLDEAKEYIDSAEFESNAASPADSQVARHKIVEYLTLKGISDDRLDLFETAVGEAITNAIKHSKGNCIYAGVRDSFIWVAVSDRGHGISALTLPSATLRRGFSTKVSMGMGYTIMMEATDKILLCTGPEGTTVILLVSIIAHSNDLTLDDFQDTWNEN